MVFSNSSCAAFLDTGKMARNILTTGIKTTIKYVSKDGRARYKGSAALKGTQQLGVSQISFTFLWLYIIGCIILNIV